MKSEKNTLPAAGSGPTEAGVRQRLLEAAMELFASQGYATTSVREIVERAGVTKPTLYYYFQSKEGIYLAMLEEVTAEFEALVDGLEAAGGSPWERIRGLCLELHELCERRLPLVRLLYAIYYGPAQGTPGFDFERFHQRFEDTLVRLLEEAMTAGEIGEGSREDMALAILGLADVVREMALIHPERELGRDGLARLLDLLYQGIGRSGRKRQR